MKSNHSRIVAVPTNIITGFLGVGKTTAILHLLKHKPSQERWAVLVNEFGEIGVDGSLIEGQSSSENGIFVREVPGGCMCCAAGLPMQVALTQLLAKAKPDRLLIEPTGLGHPVEVIDVLRSSHYQETLLLQKTLTLVDARKLTDTRYTNHETFNQQIEVADIIIGNKCDLYQEQDQERLIRYVQQKGKENTKVLFARHGDIEFSILNGSTENLHQQSFNQSHHHHKHQTKLLASDMSIPESGYVKAVNKGEGFNSIGWRFSPEKIFSHKKLFSLLTGLQLERMKAVFITDRGVYGYNFTHDGLTEIELDDCLESSVEMISEKHQDSLEDKLFACIVD